MSEQKSSYTFFILPDNTSKPYCLSIQKKRCHVLLGVILVLAVMGAGFSFNFLSGLGRPSELDRLRAENKNRLDELKAMSNTLDDLNTQMARLSELDRKLRILTELPPQKEVVDLSAQGGSETELSPEGEAGNAQKEGQPSLEFTAPMKRRAELLKRQMAAEESSFDTLIKTISEMKLRWAGTPSIWPVDGWISSNFGKRISPFTGKWVMHNGIDIAARKGSPVVSPAVGVVNRVGYSSDLGNLVTIRHGDGKITYFGHLSRQTVRKGERVVRGQTVGLVGSTGQSTGSHLHYEVRINNVPVDPMRYILN